MLKQILIIGYFGFDNFGDETLLYALINDLVRVGFKRENLTVISKNPNKTNDNFKVNAINRWSFFDVLGSILNTNCVIFTGGLFQDKTSFKSFLYYFFILYLAKILRKQIVFYGIGIGPFQRNISYKLFDLGVSNINYITVRDNTSSNYFLDKTKVVVSCDPVWSLEGDFTVQNEIKSINWELPTVAVCLRNDTNLRDHQLMEIAEKLARIITGMKDWQIIFIPCMPNEDIPILYDVYDLLLSKTNAHNRITFVENFSRFSITQQIGLLASCDVVISMRYHPLLISISNGKPVFGIICDQKIKSLLDFSNQIGVLLKDDINQPWSYFWQNLEKAQGSARDAKEKADKLHKRNIELLERL